MSSHRSLLATIGAAAVLSFALAGCYIVPAQPYYADAEVVAVAPPAPQVEVIGVAPAPGYIWIGGYWGWSGYRHVWYPGYWNAPRAGYRWYPHAWVQVNGGWRESRGHWGR